VEITGSFFGNSGEILGTPGYLSSNIRGGQELIKVSPEIMDIE
jgi:hypothetical protein